jgi:hypothetical protein
VVKRLEDLNVIKPYQPQPPSARVSISLAHSRRKPYGKNLGLYKLGRGQKSVTWSWEFDTDKRYFHEFRTVSFTEAMRMYQKSKFEMWKMGWEQPS